LRFEDVVKYAELIEEKDVLGFVTILTIIDNAFLKQIREKEEV